METQPAVAPSLPRFALPLALRAELFTHARQQAPLECCGLLGGHRNKNTWRARRVYQLVNEAHSTTEFLALEGLIAPFKQMRAEGEELVGIYHSHPTTPPMPSATDLARNYYPQTPHLIISLRAPEPELAAFLLYPHGFTTIELIDVQEPASLFPQDGENFVTLS